MRNVAFALLAVLLFVGTGGAVTTLTGPPATPADVAAAPPDAASAPPNAPALVDSAADTVAALDTTTAPAAGAVLDTTTAPAAGTALDTTTAPGAPTAPAVGASDGAEQLGFSVLETRFFVALDETGDATWNVTVRYELRDESERTAFRELAQEYERGETTAGPSITVWERGAAAASNATGRSMEVTGVERDSRVGTDSGVLILRFDWSNFANRLENGQFQIGDAFRAPDGSWFPALEAEQTLVIEAPPAAGFITSTVGVENRQLTVTGPRSIGNETINATYQLDTTPTPTDTPTVTTTTASPTPTPTPGGVPTEMIGLGLLALLAIVAVAYAAFGEDLGLSGAPVADDEPPAPPGPEEPTPQPDDEEETDDGIDPELLSDEERVERLLAENGGRMRQAAIVDETGWSDAKVSQLLSAMADDDRIDKLRIGRENLISLPDEDESE